MGLVAMWAKRLRGDTQPKESVQVKERAPFFKPQYSLDNKFLYDSVEVY